MEQVHSYLFFSLSLSLAHLVAICTEYLFNIYMFRQTAQGTEVLSTRPRILVSFNFLVISGIISDDQGTYTCSASNGAATVEASATLTVFGQSNLIVMDIRNFFSPSQDRSCHHFNTSNFEV